LKAADRAGTLPAMATRPTSPTSPPSPATPAGRARPNGWLLAFSFLVMLISAVPPAALLASVDGKGWAGILAEGPNDPFVRPSRPNESAGRIRMLDPDGPAARAGIRASDRVVAIGGHPLGDSAGLAVQAAAARPGDVVRFTVLRDSVPIHKDVRLAGYLDGIDDRILAVLYLLFGIAYFAIGYLVYVRRPDDRRAGIFHGLTLSLAVSFIGTTALTGPFFLRGLEGGLSDSPLMIVSLVFLIASGYVSMGLFLHFALAFPRRRPVLRAWPRLPVLLHGTAPALALAAFLAVGFAFVPGFKSVGARVALLVAFLAALAPLLWALRGRARWLERPVHTLLAFALAWGALGVGMKLLQPYLGMPGKIALLVVGAIPLATILLLPVAAGIATIVFLLHSWNESDLEARQQIRWPAIAVVVNLLAGAVMIAVSFLATRMLDARDSMILQRVAEYLSLAVSLVIPLAFAVAILKYRLFDLGIVLRRTATYGIATFALGALYLALVAGIGAALVAPLGADAGNWPAVLGTLGVAALFVPARNWAQRLVDRSFFRVRYDAPASLGRLGRALASAPDPELKARATLEELVTSLRLRGASVDLRTPDERGVSRLAALGTIAPPAQGTPAPGRSVVPLVRNGRAFGWLHAGERLSDQPLDEDDEAYLFALSEQLALALGPAFDPANRRELDEARRIQAALLPQSLPALSGHSIAALWQPAREVAGDYYDVLPLSGNRVALCIADVAGKGMPAALLMSNLQATVKAFAASDPDPAELCERVNRAFAGNLAPGRFITLFYGCFEPHSGRLVWANAGHNPPLVLRADGTTTWLSASGPLLGPFADAQFAAEAIDLFPGDRLILYTDGVTEAMDAAGDLFGEERLERALTGAGPLDAMALKDCLLATVRAFCADEFDDDATVLVLGVDA
jgi:hypothetical protein